MLLRFAGKKEQWRGELPFNFKSQIISTNVCNIFLYRRLSYISKRNVAKTLNVHVLLNAGVSISQLRHILLTTRILLEFQLPIAHQIPIVQTGMIIFQFLQQRTYVRLIAQSSRTWPRVTRSHGCIVRITVISNELSCRLPINRKP